MIEFVNIESGETVGIDRSKEGKWYRAKLSALVNSSNLGINADRGQDYGYRLKPEQQAQLEQWEEDPETIGKVSQFTQVPVDELGHADFLAWMIYQQELGNSPERNAQYNRREKQLEYEERVAKLKAEKAPEAVPQFEVSVPVEVPTDGPTEESTMPKKKK